MRDLPQKQEEQNSTKLKAKNQICQGIFRRAATLFYLKKWFCLNLPPPEVNIAPNARPPTRGIVVATDEYYFFPQAHTFVHSRVQEWNGRRCRPRGGWVGHTDTSISCKKLEDKKILCAKNLKIRGKVKKKQKASGELSYVQKYSILLQVHLCSGTIK